MEKQELLRKYPNEEDKLSISKILDKIKAVENRNYLVYTDFLNLREQKITEEILNIQKFKNYIFFGREQNLERKIIILYPEKLTKELAIQQAKINLNVIRIILPKSNEKEFTHRDYLGIIMKLGIKREKVGDIIVGKKVADIIVEKEITKFLLEELPKFTRFQKSTIQVLEIDELSKIEQNFEEITVIVPSYRLDSIVTEIARTSRSKAVELIEAERVYINFEICTKNSKTIKIGDIITIRGKGRFKIAEELGNTKKDNIRIKILTFKT